MSITCIWITSSGGCSAQRSSARYAPSCAIKRGCPAKLKLDRCSADVAKNAQPLPLVIATAPRLLGRTVTVRSRLHRMGRVCTRLHCARGSCCNRCTSTLVVTTTAKPSHFHPTTVTLTNSGAGPYPHAKLTCSGDDSKVCCPLATGQEVLVVGQLARRGTSIHGPTYVVRNPRICLP